MAEYSPFHVTVSNVTGALFDGEATSLSVPGTDGTMTILAHHEPLIALLKEGLVVIAGRGGEKQEYSVKTGVLEVSGNHAIVLV